MSAGAGREVLATKANRAALRADLRRALWIPGGAVVAVLGGFVAIAAALEPR